MIGKLTAAVLASGAVLLAQQPARDARPAPAIGTGAIGGVVLTADANPVPIRGAHVTLSGAELLGGRIVITDESGLFRFTGLPKGRFTLAASKSAYLAANYGAKRPAGPGVSIALTEGQTLTDLRMTMHKGGVVTGRIVDERGRPIPDADVYASRLEWFTGERRFAGQGSATSDDGGVYRIFGLPPGEFVVRAEAPYAGYMASVRRLEPGAIDAALDPQRAPPSPVQVGGPTVGSSPIYFPGTPRREDATLLPLSVGEERSGVDFTVRLVPTATIEGTVTWPAGRPDSSVRVTLYGGALPSTGRGSFSQPQGESGSFGFAGIQPGHYVIIARTSPAAGSQPDASLWASTELEIDGRNVSGLQLALQPGLTISGRLVLDRVVAGATASDWQVGAVTADNSAGSRTDGPAPVAADGTFTIRGVLPGRYRIRAATPNATLSRTWLLKAALVDGVDAVDVPIDVRGDVANAALTLTTARSELSGTLQSATGEPAPDYFVIAFPVDRRFWTSYSRHIKAVRPGSDGAFRFTDLPASEYYLVALTDVEQGEWLNPAFLERLVPAAFKVVLADGEKKVQDIRIAK